MVIIEFPIIQDGTTSKMSFNPIQIESVIETYTGVYINTLYDIVNNDKGVQGILMGQTYANIKTALLAAGLFYELTQESGYPVLFNAIQTVGIAPVIGSTKTQVMQNALNNTTVVNEDYLTVKALILAL